jgi:hypothetical protein
LVATIERLIGGDLRQVVQLVVIAVSALFADLLVLSATLPASDAKLADVINEQLAESGWKLVRRRGTDLSRAYGPSTAPGLPRLPPPEETVIGKGLIQITDDQASHI